MKFKLYSLSALAIAAMMTACSSDEEIVQAPVNVAEVAEMFSGGGHVRAAGCTVSGTSHDVINNITKYIHKQLYGV